MDGLVFVVKNKTGGQTHAIFSDRLTAEEFIKYLAEDRGIHSTWVSHSVDLYKESVKRYFEKEKEKISER